MYIEKRNIIELLIYIIHKNDNEIHQSLKYLPQASSLLLEKPLQKSKSILKLEREFSAMEFDEGDFPRKNHSDTAL